MVASLVSSIQGHFADGAVKYPWPWEGEFDLGIAWRNLEIDGKLLDIRFRINPKCAYIDRSQ